MKIKNSICKYLTLIALTGVVLWPVEAPTESVDLSEILRNATPYSWSLYQAVKRYTPLNLYERINGRASYFLAYDMSGMTYACYTNIENPAQFIDLYIYDMGTVTNAFGVFSSERSQDDIPLDAGQSGYTHQYGIAMVRLTRANVKLVACDMGKNFDVVFRKEQLIGGALAVDDRELALKTAVELWQQIPEE